MGSGISMIGTKYSVCRDDFVFSSTIGVGGFSSVLSTMHVPSKTWMALKETSIRGICNHKKGLSMLASEVRILAHLAIEKHRFIVNLHFAFRDNHKCYMALDLHPGGDLRYHIRSKRAFSEKIVAFYAICLSSALHFVHGKGILHRDIKPENIILDSLGFPYLTDFGVSTMTRTDKELICTGSSGTRQYLAPEVFTTAHTHGVEADFWSLGVMLYEFVYGRRPFNKHCYGDMIRFHEDLKGSKIRLSSTSSRFAPAGGGAEDLCPSDWTSVYMDTAMPSADKDLDDRKHWLHVATSIKNSEFLSTRVECLRRSACQDMMLDESENTPASGSHHPSSLPLAKTYSVRHCSNTEVSFPTRRGLPVYLRVQMPKYSHNSKRVSQACISVLEGLLDVRLWSRLGAGSNYNRLRDHVWFQECKLTWKDVEEGRVLSPYTPNVTKVTRELAFKHDQEKGLRAPLPVIVPCTATTAENNFNKLLSKLITSDKNILNHFHYVAPQYCADDADADDEGRDDKQRRNKGTNYSGFGDVTSYTTAAPPTCLYSE